MPDCAWKPTRQPARSSPAAAVTTIIALSSEAIMVSKTLLIWAPSVDLEVVQPPGRLGDRAAHRGVHGERLGELVRRQRLGHRHRHRVDELAGPRRDDDPAHDDAR